VLGRRLQEEHAQFDRGWSVTAVPLTGEVVKDVRVGLELLLGAIGLVILLVSAKYRGHDAGPRDKPSGRDLGTTRPGGVAGKIECGSSSPRVLLLALAGGAIGCGLGYAGLEAIKSFGPIGIPRLADARIDSGVLAFNSRFPS